MIALSALLLAMTPARPGCDISGRDKTPIIPLPNYASRPEVRRPWIVHVIGAAVRQAHAKSICKGLTMGEVQWRLGQPESKKGSLDVVTAVYRDLGLVVDYRFVWRLQDDAREFVVESVTRLGVPR